ncbi:hypothetical protein [Micromonospora sp. NPDC093277]|uniref:hypothetical protein n=1 Tax=Micromonospora sp. NPDC093277 TaxID=3364291 RepID=UPI0038169A60
MTGPPEPQPRSLVVPAGTLLRLAATEWADCADLTHDTDVAVVLSVVRTDPTHVGWTCVIGHRPQCEYADEHPPYIELRVRTAVLHRFGSPP